MEEEQLVKTWNGKFHVSQIFGTQPKLIIKINISFKQQFDKSKIKFPSRYCFGKWNTDGMGSEWDHRHNHE